MKLVFKIQKPLAAVFQYLADTNKFVEVHPVITKMIRKSDNSYRVYETLKLGFLPVRFTYRAFIKPDPLSNKVYMKAVVARFMEINFAFSLSADGDTTTIEDQIDIKSPGVVTGIIERIIKTQHEKLFDNIARLKG